MKNKNLTIDIAHSCEDVGEALDAASAYLSGDYVVLALKPPKLETFMVTPDGKMLFYHDDWAITLFPKVPTSQTGRMGKWKNGSLHIYGHTMKLDTRLVPLLQKSPNFMVPTCVLEQLTEDTDFQIVMSALVDEYDVN